MARFQPPANVRHFEIQRGKLNACALGYKWRCRGRPYLLMATTNIPKFSWCWCEKYRLKLTYIFPNINSSERWCSRYISSAMMRMISTVVSTSTIQLLTQRWVRCFFLKLHHGFNLYLIDGRSFPSPLRVGKEIELYVITLLMVEVTVQQFCSISGKRHLSSSDTDPWKAN